MNLTLPIPDDLANRLSADGGDLSRRALEPLRWRSTRASAYQRLNCGACWVSRHVTSSMAS